MSFKTEKQDNYTVITFSTDKLDAVVAPDLKGELVMLNKNNEKNILIDLSSVKYCDSSGLSSLLIGYRMCNEAGGSFVLTGIQPAVQKLFTISQLDSILTVSASLDEAMVVLNS